MRCMLRLLAWNGSQSLAEYDTFDKNEKSLLPANQLRLLYIQFAAFKEDDKAGKALQQFKADYILSQRELCLSLFAWICNR